MKRVLILGGTFDPIHRGHIDIATAAYENYKYDEVWFLIARKPRWKRGVTPVAKRLKMLELAICDYPAFSICKEEIDSPLKTENYTYDTMTSLIAKYPDIEFSYLIGADQLDKLNEWKEIDKLASMIKFLCVKRPKFVLNTDNARKYNVEILEIEGPNISSSELRLHYNEKLVPSMVNQYIVNHQMYLESRIKSYMSLDRLLHTISTAKLAKKIAQSNAVDEKRVYIACLLHDIGKEYDKEKAKAIIKSDYADKLSMPEATYHQYISEYLAKKDFKIKDEQILSAIAKHCTADKNMSRIDKIVYAADKIEPTRGYDSSYLIEACMKDIDEGYDEVYKANMDYLESRNEQIITHETKLVKNNILETIVKTIDGKKGKNIIAIDVSNVNPIVKYYVICDVSSERQNEAVANALDKALFEINYPIRRIEGKSGDRKWLLVDANDYVIHIFDQNERARYKLEVLWGDQPQVDISAFITED
jgi:nicotinate-nucleotide adenylyltransferase